MVLSVKNGLLGVAVALSVFAAACSGAAGSSAPGDVIPAEANVAIDDVRNGLVEELPDALEGFPKGAEQLAKVCGRGQDDKVTRALCNNPELGSIRDLQSALGLGFRDRSAQAQNGGRGNPAFALLGHSTSLVTRSVSAINPRAFVFSPPPGRPERIKGFIVMGFARGEPFVEIAAEDAATETLTFYLLKLDLACSATKSCKPGDLLTPAVEKDWKGWSLYQDEDLKNTILDCRQCHQPGGPSTKPMLRMQELEDPWTHWFRGDRPGGLALMQDYQRAHGTEEEYFGIPGSLIESADGLALEDFVKGQGFEDQPNVFDSKQIEDEVKRSSRMQPEVNTPTGHSAAWQRLYSASSAGEFIPVPYHDVKVTDPDKLAFATNAYRRVIDGKDKASSLPDIRRVFLDAALPEMSMRPKPGASGKEILVQACAQCHNARLDTSLSRARFDVTNLEAMDPAMKSAAIARLKLPPSSLQHMPPAMFRTLPDAALTLAVDELSK